MIIDTISICQKPEDSLYVFARHRYADEFCLVAQSQSNCAPEARDPIGDNDLFNWDKTNRDLLADPLPGSGVFYYLVDTDESWRRILEPLESNTQTLVSDYRDAYLQNYLRKNPSGSKELFLYTIIIYLGTPVDRSSHEALASVNLGAVLSPIGMIFINLPRARQADFLSSWNSSAKNYASLAVVIGSLIESACREALEAVDVRFLVRSQEVINHRLEYHYSANSRSSEAGAPKLGRKDITRVVLSRLIETIQLVTRENAYNHCLYVVTGQFTVQKFHFDREQQRLETAAYVVNADSDAALHLVLEKQKCIASPPPTKQSDRRFDLMPIRLLIPLLHDQQVRGVVELLLDHSPRFLGWTIFQWLPLFDHCRSGLIHARRRLQRENLLHFTSLWLEQNLSDKKRVNNGGSDSLVATDEFASQLQHLVKALGAAQVQVFQRHGNAEISGWLHRENAHPNPPELLTQASERIRVANPQVSGSSNGLTMLLFSISRSKKGPIVVLQHNIIQDVPALQSRRVVQSECFLLAESVESFDQFDESTRRSVRVVHEAKVARVKVGARVVFDGVDYVTEPNPAIADADRGGRDGSHSRVGIAIHDPEGQFLIDEGIVLWFSYDGLADFTWSEHNLALIAAKNLGKTLKRSVIEMADSLLGHELRGDIVATLGGGGDVRRLNDYRDFMVDRIDLVNFMLRFHRYDSKNTELKEQASSLLRTPVLCKGVASLFERLLKLDPVPYRARSRERGKPIVVLEPSGALAVIEARVFSAETSGYVVPRGFRLVLTELINNIKVHAGGCKKVGLAIDDFGSGDYVLSLVNCEGARGGGSSARGEWSGGVGLKFLKQVVGLAGGRLCSGKREADLLWVGGNLKNAIAFVAKDGGGNGWFCVCIRLNLGL